jgi:hypothetical protein
MRPRILVIVRLGNLTVPLEATFLFKTNCHSKKNRSLQPHDAKTLASQHVKVTHCATMPTSTHPKLVDPI